MPPVGLRTNDKYYDINLVKRQGWQCFNCGHELVISLDFFLWSRITKYICSSSTPNLLSVRDLLSHRGNLALTGAVHLLTIFSLCYKSTKCSRPHLARLRHHCGSHRGTCGHELLIHYVHKYSRPRLDRFIPRKGIKHVSVSHRSTKEK